MAVAGLVVLGSGPAGVSAALAYREAGGDGAVQIFTADGDIPYERPPLSKEVLNGSLGLDKSPLINPADAYAEHDIDIRYRQAARALDLSAHTVTTDEGTFGFRSCVIATGARPSRPPLPGVDHPKVFTLRSHADAARLIEAAESSRRAVVVGSGFIGCEAAASLARRGLAVTLISTEVAPQIERLGPWAAGRIAGWLNQAGVELIAGRGLAAIEADGARPRVVTSSDSAFATDLVVLAVGVERDVEPFRSAGLAVDDGRVRVDSGMRTSVATVFAAGDVVRAYHRRAGRYLGVEHWGDALAMGEIAGANAAGRQHEWSSAPGFWSTIGDRTLKYAAWGDGYDEVRIDERPDGGFAIWYGRAGRVVGVLTHQCDEDYEAGTGMVEQGDALPAA